MQVSKQNTGIEKRYGAITVDEVKPSLNPKKHQAQIRQTVLSIYPGVRPGNSLADALFSAEEFGAEAQEFAEERVTWISVPIGTTAEQVAERLAKLKNARLVKILSLSPILSDEQKNAMANGISRDLETGEALTIDSYREKQAVRYGDNHTMAGQKVLYKEKYEQYRAIAFMDGKNGPVEDIDLREESLRSTETVHMGEGAEQKVTF